MAGTLLCRRTQSPLRSRTTCSDRAGKNPKARVFNSVAGVALRDAEMSPSLVAKTGFADVCSRRILAVQRSHIEWQLPGAKRKPTSAIAGFQFCPNAVIQCGGDDGLRWVVSGPLPNAAPMARMRRKQPVVPMEAFAVRRSIA